MDGDLHPHITLSHFIRIQGSWQALLSCNDRPVWTERNIQRCVELSLFQKKMVGAAFIDAILIWVTVLLMMICAGRYTTLSALLLAPYLLWVAFAAYLTYAIGRLNGLV